MILLLLCCPPCVDQMFCKWINVSPPVGNGEMVLQYIWCMLYECMDPQYYLFWTKRKYNSSTFGSFCDDKKKVTRISCTCDDAFRWFSWWRQRPSWRNFFFFFWSSNPGRNVFFFVFSRAEWCNNDVWVVNSDEINVGELRGKCYCYIYIYIWTQSAIKRRGGMQPEGGGGGWRGEFF